MLPDDIFDGNRLKKTVRSRLLETLYAAGLKKEELSCYLVGSLATEHSRHFDPIQLVCCLADTSADEFNEQIGKYLVGIQLPDLKRRLEVAFQNGTICLDDHVAVCDVKNNGVWFKGEPVEPEMARSAQKSFDLGDQTQLIDTEAGKPQPATQTVICTIPDGETPERFEQTLKSWYPYWFVINGSKGPQSFSETGTQIQLTTYKRTIPELQKVIQSYWQLAGKQKAKPKARDWSGIDVQAFYINLPTGVTQQQLEQFLRSEGVNTFIATQAGSKRVKIESYAQDTARLKTLIDFFLEEDVPAPAAPATEAGRTKITIPPEVTPAVTPKADWQRPHDLNVVELKVAIGPVTQNQLNLFCRAYGKQTGTRLDYYDLDGFRVFRFVDPKARGALETALRRNLPGVRIAQGWGWRKQTSPQQASVDYLLAEAWEVVNERTLLDRYDEQDVVLKKSFVPARWTDRTLDLRVIVLPNGRCQELWGGPSEDTGAAKVTEHAMAWLRAGDISQGEQRNASAFISDIRFGDLPKDTQKDILQFHKCTADTLLPQYGMVVSELLPKADPHNLESAREHVKDTAKKTLEKEVYGKAETKYLLLTNGRLIDGHHYLAKAERAGVTRTLRVLDLTPLRFQKRKGGKRLAYFTNGATVEEAREQLLELIGDYLGEAADVDQSDALGTPLLHSALKLAKTIVFVDPQDVERFACLLFDHGGPPDEAARKWLNEAIQDDLEKFAQTHEKTVPGGWKWHKAQKQEKLRETRDPTRKFWLDPACRLRRCTEHEDLLPEITGLAPAALARFDAVQKAYARGWVRLVIDGEEIYYVGKPTTKQLKELKDQATEQGLNLRKGQRELEEAVGMAIGEASTCWANLEGAGVFDSTHAIQVADRLLDTIARIPLSNRKAAMLDLQLPAKRIALSNRVAAGYPDFWIDPEGKFHETKEPHADWAVENFPELDELTFQTDEEEAETGDNPNDKIVDIMLDRGWIRAVTQPRAEFYVQYKRIKPVQLRAIKDYAIEHNLMVIGDNGRVIFQPEKREAAAVNGFPTAYLGRCPEGIALLFVSKSPVTKQPRLNYMIYPAFEVSKFEDSKQTGSEWLESNPPQWGQRYHLDTAPGHESSTRADIISLAELEPRLESLARELDDPIGIPIGQTNVGLASQLDQVNRHNLQYA